MVQVNSFSKTYAMTGLRVGYQDCALEMRQSYLERRDMLVAGLNEISGIH